MVFAGSGGVRRHRGRRIWLADWKQFGWSRRCVQIDGLGLCLGVTEIGSKTDVGAEEDERTEMTGHEIEICGAILDLEIVGNRGLDINRIAANLCAILTEIAGDSIGAGGCIFAGKRAVEMGRSRSVSYGHDFSGKGNGNAIIGYAALSEKKLLCWAHSWIAFLFSLLSVAAANTLKKKKRLFVGLAALHQGMVQY